MWYVSLVLASLKLSVLIDFILPLSVVEYVNNISKKLQQLSLGIYHLYTTLYKQVFIIYVCFLYMFYMLYAFYYSMNPFQLVIKPITTKESLCTWLLAASSKTELSLEIEAYKDAVSGWH